MLGKRKSGLSILLENKTLEVFVEFNVDVQEIVWKKVSHLRLREWNSHSICIVERRWFIFYCYAVKTPV